MRFLSCSIVSLALVLGVAATGCASTAGEETEESTENLTTLHEPQGAERKAIHAAFRDQLSRDLNNQTIIFNSKDPPGRYLVHGD